MPTPTPLWRSTLASIIRYWWVAAIAAAAVAIAVVYRSIQEHPPVSVQLVRDTRIDISPEEVRTIREIGQWEFLAVSTEELVEWNRHRSLGNDRLVRIYTGTLRLGIDMSRAKDDWFTSLPDSTARLQLPSIALLDSDFIDEARARSFYEKGTCPPEAREQLYNQARQAMLRRCLTPQNLKAAEQNAREQFTRIFLTFGFKKVEITFQPETASH